MLAWLRTFFRSSSKPFDDSVPVRLLAALAHRHAAFDALGIDHALIGGCALAAHRVVRATADIDFLVEADHTSRLHDYMTSEGFAVLLRTENVSNYLAANGERLDFIHARRAYTREMLAAAVPHYFGEVQVRVVQPEDIIGLKVQASSNDPNRRALDMSDIRRLLQEHMATMNMSRLRTYFSIFEREEELNELLRSL